MVVEVNRSYGIKTGRAKCRFNVEAIGHRKDLVADYSKARDSYKTMDGYYLDMK